MSIDDTILHIWNSHKIGHCLLNMLRALPDAGICIKDRVGRILWANPAWAALHGYRSTKQILGKTVVDFYEAHLAEQVAADDQRVMASRRSENDRVWLLSDGERPPRWLLCSKFPLYETEQEAVGIAIMLRELGQPLPAVSAGEGMKAVLWAIVTRHAGPLRIQELAKLVYLSHSQFDRRFKESFQQTPQQCLLHVRLQSVCHALCYTTDGIAEIAARTGFSDQAHLSRLFRKEMHTTPTGYRRRYQVTSRSP